MSVQRSDFAHFLQIPTRWSDLDALNHVNNTRFFTFDESARLDYFGRFEETDPQKWGHSESGLILARLECDFVAQVRHPAMVETGFRVARMGKSSMSTVAGMFVGDRLVAVSRGVVVWFNYAAQKAQAIPESVRAQIRAFEPIKPEEA